MQLNSAVKRLSSGIVYGRYFYIDIMCACTFCCTVYLVYYVAIDNVFFFMVLWFIYVKDAPLRGKAIEYMMGTGRIRCYFS